MSRSVSAPSSVTKTSPCWNGDMVPGSTLRYGSSLISVTCNPRASSNAPIEEAARPLPRLETTPPVTKMYLGICHLLGTHASGVLILPSTARRRRAYRPPLPADRPPLPCRRKFRAADLAALRLIFSLADPEFAANPSNRQSVRQAACAVETPLPSSRRMAWLSDSAGAGRQ